MHRHMTIVLLAVMLTASDAAAEKTVKQSFTSGGKTRSYYVFVPDKASAQAPAPLLVLLHGSGRNGLSLVERWEGLAKKEGLILAGPDSTNPTEWRTPKTVRSSFTISSRGCARNIRSTRIESTCLAIPPARFNRCSFQCWSPSTSRP